MLSASDNFSTFYCDHYSVSVAIESSILQTGFGAEKRERLLDLVVQNILKPKSCVMDTEKPIWHFYFDPDNKSIYNGLPEHINLARQLIDYPTQFIDLTNQTLLNLAKRYPRYGEVIYQSWYEHRLYFDRAGVHSYDDGIVGVLKDFGYVKMDKGSSSFVITAQGWQKIDELKKEEKVVNQAFIAMIFREEANSIREAFRRAIHEMGYMAVVLDEKEHNNQIVPEIFYEIKRSKFVVVDVTYPSYGAYYEAGYAQALDKEVIICCRRDVFDDTNKTPHFDISQKSIIVWDDEEDLVRRLKRRIEATIT